MVAAPIIGAAPLPPAEASYGFTHRVNARWQQITDSRGNVWSPRSGFAGPADRSDILRATDIRGTSNDAPYQSNLYGLTGYDLSVPAGSYQVRLLMAEDYHTAAGRRVFNVSAEGRTVLSDVDIVRAVGTGAAYDRSFTTNVIDGTLNLGFSAKADKALVSAIEVVRTGAASGTATAPAPSPAPSPAPTSSDTPAGTDLLTTSHDVQWAGRQPTFSTGTITSSAGGGDARSEVFWETPQSGRIRLPRYASVTAEFDVWHQLQNPSTGQLPDSSTWHVLYQLLGPTQANTWPGPPLTVAWANGTYRIGGGAAVPDASGTLRFKGSWFAPYPAAPLNTWRTFKITTYLDGPGSGWVSIWIDGKQVMNRWKPLAGTFYTGAGSYSHKDVQVKTGLYTGTNSPTWTRSAKHRNIRLTWTVGGTTRSATYRG